MTSARIIEVYARERGNDAFAALVSAHVDLVYSSALRQVRDAALAEDVTQLVFMALARQAPRLRTHMPLEAWLLGVTRHLALDACRRRARRQRHELEAVMSKPTPRESKEEADWTAIAPHLDDALADLRAVDQQLIILRFMRDLPLRQVGQQVGMSENTAGRRIVRILEKLRQALVRRGVSLPAAAIAGALAAHGISRAPSALAGTISHSAVLAAQSTFVPGLGGIVLMTSAKTKTAAALFVLFLVSLIAIPFAIWRPMTEAPAAKSPVSSAPAVTAAVPVPDAPMAVAPDELAGRILDETGSPLEGATISFPMHRPLNLPDRVTPTLTNAEGMFRYPGFGNTWYVYMEVSKEGYAVHWETALTIGKPLEIRLDRATRLTGIVMLPDKSPAPQCVLEFVASRPTTRKELPPTIDNLRFSAASDAQGRFDLPVESGSYDLQVTGPAGLFARIPALQIKQGEILNQPISLAPGIPLKVRAVNSVTGKPVPNVTFYFERRYPGSIHPDPGTYRTSDADGIAEWTGLMPWAQKLSVSGLPEYARWTSVQSSTTKSPLIDTRAIDAVNLDLQHAMPEVVIRMEPSMHLKAKVVDSRGDPVPNVNVNIDGIQTGDYRYAKHTNAGGEADLYVPATLVSPFTRCALAVLSNESSPQVLATSEKFWLSVGGEKSVTIMMKNRAPGPHP